MSRTAASHQGVFHMFWPQFCAAVMKSILYKFIFMHYKINCIINTVKFGTGDISELDFFLVYSICFSSESVDTSGERVFLTGITGSSLVAK